MSKKFEITLFQVSVITERRTIQVLDPTWRVWTSSPPPFDRVSIIGFFQVKKGWGGYKSDRKVWDTLSPLPPFGLVSETRIAERTLIINRMYGAKNVSSFILGFFLVLIQLLIDGKQVTYFNYAKTIKIIS